jgi:hypothetical protein
MIDLHHWEGYLIHTRIRCLKAKLGKGSDLHTNYWMKVKRDLAENDIGHHKQIVYRHSIISIE